MIYFLRVLAVAPSTKGFGFAVMEEPNLLIDWGVKAVSGDKNVQCVRLVSTLLDFYKPDMLILEDCSVKNCWRRSRVRSLIRQLTALATTKKIKTRHISRAAVRKAFSPNVTLTKHQIAMTVASQFPELMSDLPNKRKPWMSENYKMGIFDAVALSSTLFNLKLKK
jgi:hypothetical protein